MTHQNIVTPRIRKLLIENHPDRWGGDHSRMEKVFAAQNQKQEYGTCEVCGVSVRGKLCMAHARERRYNLKRIAAIVTIFVLSGIWCHAQRGTMAFVKFNSADILTWTDGTNRFPVFTEVQLQTGTDKTWRTVAMVAGTNTVMIPKDARSTRYRVRHVHQVGGASSTWCYKSTK